MGEATDQTHSSGQATNATANDAVLTFRAMVAQAKAAGFEFQKGGEVNGVATMLGGKRMLGPVVDYLWLSGTSPKGSMAGRYSLADNPETRDEVTGDNVPVPLLSTQGTAVEVVVEVLGWPRPDQAEAPKNSGRNGTP